MYLSVVPSEEEIGRPGNSYLHPSAFFDILMVGKQIGRPPIYSIRWSILANLAIENEANTPHRPYAASALAIEICRLEISNY